MVHGKGSLLAKMAGDDWQKFANLRAYYAFMWGYPGKKLLFMGQEFAPWNEWSEARGLDWYHAGACAASGRAVPREGPHNCYRHTPALHARDCEPEGFEWLQADDRENSVYAWARHSGQAALSWRWSAISRPCRGMAMCCPCPGRLVARVVNTDAGDYGGSGMGNMGGVEGRGRTHACGSRPCNAKVTLPPPLSTLYFMLD